MTNVTNDQIYTLMRSTKPTATVTNELVYKMKKNKRVTIFHQRHTSFTFTLTNGNFYFRLELDAVNI